DLRTSNGFQSVAAVSPNNVLAVGDYCCNSQGFIQTLTERYSDPCAPPTLTPTPSPTSTPTFTAIQTPTPTANATNTPSCQLIGHVIWQGPSPYPGLRQQLPITLTLKLGATEVNYPAQATDSGGF